MALITGLPAGETSATGVPQEDRETEVQTVVEVAVTESVTSASPVTAARALLAAAVPVEEQRVQVVPADPPVWVLLAAAAVAGGVGVAGVVGDKWYSVEAREK